VSVSVVVKSAGSNVNSGELLSESNTRRRHDGSSQRQPTVTHGNDTRRRCDDDLSHSEPVRCASNLSTQRRRHQWSADDRTRLISNHFCVNSLQLMVSVTDRHSSVTYIRVRFVPETHTPQLLLL